ncbi:MAG: hypothetical protein ACL93V_06775 [Candidatus Electrothrix sp. YB6]
MLTFIFIITGLLLVVAQTTLFMPSPLWTASPDLYYILVGYLAYHVSFFQGIIILLPIGTVLDIYSGTVLGMYPAICYSGYFLLKLMAARMPVRQSLYQIPLIACSYLLVTWVLFLLLDFLQPKTVADWQWISVLFRTVLIYLCSFPLFRFFAFLDRRCRGRISSLRVNRRPGNQFRQHAGRS